MIKRFPSGLVLIIPFAMIFMMIVVVHVGLAAYTTLLVVISLLFFTGMVFLAARWQVQPIVELNRASKALARGEWAHKVTLNRRGAVGELAGSFNQMAGQLQAFFVSLQSSEARYRSLFEDSPVSMWEEDFSALKSYVNQLRESGITDWRAYFESHPEAVRYCAGLVKVIDVNQATLKLLHCESKERLLTNLQQVFEEESYRVFREELIALAEGKGHFESEIVHQTFQGNEIWVNLKLSVVQGYAESWWRVLVSLMDVTESHKTAQSLRQSEIQFRLLAENSTDLISRHDPAGVYLYVSPACRTLLGYDPDDLLGHSAYEFIHPDDQAAVTNSLTHILEQPITYTVEFRIRCKDGRYLWLETTSRVIHDEQTGAMTEIHAASRDITARKQTEEALRASESRFRDVLENSAIALYKRDYVTHTYEYMSPAILAINGYSPEEMRLMSVEAVFAMVHPDDLLPTRHILEKIIADGGGALQLEYRFIHKNGQIRWASEIGNIFVDADGRPLTGMGSVQDITARKQVEAALEQRAARLNILHQVDQAVLAANLPAEIAQAALHYMRQLVPCQHVAVEIFDFETCEAVLLAADVNGEPERSRGFRRPLDNHWLEVFSQGQVYTGPEPEAGQNSGSLVAVPLMASGKLLGSLNLMAREPGLFTGEHFEIAREVADQLAIAIQQAQLHEAERDQRTLAEALRGSVAAVSSSLNFDDVLEQILVNVERVVPHDAANIMLIENGVARVARARGWAERGLGDWIMTLRLVSDEMIDWHKLEGSSAQPYTITDIREVPDWIGHPEDRWIRSTAKAPIQVDDQLIGILNLDSATPGFFTQEHLDRLRIFANQAAIAIENARLYEQIQRHAADLEQRVAKRTAELKAAYEELQVLSRMKDEFVSNVSHELRTPITNLKLRQFLLAKHPEKIEEHLAVIGRETDRLARTIDDLLQLSRLDQDRTEFNWGPVDLNSLVGQYAADRESILTDKQLAFCFFGEPGLPEVVADAGLLGQVLSILLTNAVNYTPAGEQISISTHARQEDDQQWVGFSVSDTGPGIPFEDQARLFTRFFRGDVGRESGVPGTGLGLAIAKEIVNRHKGRITVESAGVPGQGTTFRVWIPAKEHVSNNVGIHNVGFL